MSRQRRRQRDERRQAEAAASTNVEVPGISFAIGTPLQMPNGERWIFNITKARELLASTVYRDKATFSGQDLAQLLNGPWMGNGYGLPADKVLASDPNIPGIGAVIPYQGQRALQIIEGAERACHALHLNRPFVLEVLTDAERDQCLMSRTGVKGIGEMLISGNRPKAE